MARRATLLMSANMSEKHYYTKAHIFEFNCSNFDQAVVISGQHDRAPSPARGINNDHDLQKLNLITCRWGSHVSEGAEQSHWQCVCNDGVRLRTGPKAGLCVYNPTRGLARAQPRRRGLRVHNDNVT